LVKFFQMIGDVISWLGEKWTRMIEWISTSDSGFAKFIRGTLTPLLKGFEKLGELWDDLTGGPSALEKTVKAAQMKAGIKVEADPAEVVKEQDKNNKLLAGLDRNTAGLDSNTKAQKKEWTGKFNTSILKDMNVGDRVVSSNTVNNVSKVVSSTVNKSAQKDLAISPVNDQLSNSRLQNRMTQSKEMQTEVVTTSNTSRRPSRSSNVNGTITVNVVNRTAGKFGLEIDSEGVNVVTTGNQ